MKDNYYKRLLADEIVGGCLVVLLVVVLAIVTPILTIHSLNVLFGLHIPLNLKTWASALFLTAILQTRNYNSGKK